MRFGAVDAVGAVVLSALVGCGNPPAAGETADCRSPEPYRPDGFASEFVRCRDGAINRVSANSSDFRCLDVEAWLPDGIVPEEGAGCFRAVCRTGDDCASGECGLSRHDDGCTWTTLLACRDPAVDTCRADADCDGAETACANLFAEWDTFGCELESTCIPGRPLQVGGKPRTARPRGRSDWKAALDVSVPADPGLRRALADRWARNAALEHASVASFGRVILQLLALGAPSGLIADTLCAAADEVRHASLAYGLASAFAGVAIGPGPLALDDLEVSTDPATFLRALVDEACVSETAGAVEILGAAEAVDDPVLARVLREIGADEARHAALAWRTLRWLLTAHPALKAEAAARIEARMTDLRAATPDPLDAPAWGELGPARRALWADALSRIVSPAAAAALAA